MTGKSYDVLPEMHVTRETTVQEGSRIILSKSSESRDEFVVVESLRITERIDIVVR